MSPIRLLAALGVGATAAVVGSTAFVHRAARGRLCTEDAVPPAPVALVLGAQIIDGEPSPFLAGRLEVARRLLGAGRVQALLLSGAGHAPEGDEPAVMRDWLLARGVPNTAVVLDRAGLDTYDSCVRARDVFGVRRLLVVSQTYHLPRAVGTARLVGLDAYGVGDDSVRTYEDEHGTHRSRAWRRGVLREWAACVKTLVDLGTRRRPAMDLPSRAVDEAVSRAGP